MSHAEAHADGCRVLAPTPITPIAVRIAVRFQDARHCKTFILVADKEGRKEHPDVQGWSATGAAAIGFKSMASEADQKLIAMARDKAARQAGVPKGGAAAAATAAAAAAALAQAAPTTTKKKKKKTKKQKLQEQAIAAKLATAAAQKAAPAATKAAKPGSSSSSIKIKIKSSIKIKKAAKAPKAADVPNLVQPATATVKRKRLSNAEYHAAKSAARKAKKPKKD